MKLHLNKPAGNYIRAFEPGFLTVNERRISTSLILAADQLIENWTPADADHISLADLEPALALNPELILLGTGSGQRFADPVVATRIMQRGIGFEVMATEAACRTYNILVAEDRRVVAALLLN